MAESLTTDLFIQFNRIRQKGIDDLYTLTPDQFIVYAALLYTSSVVANAMLLVINIIEVAYCFAVFPLVVILGPMTSRTPWDNVQYCPKLLLGVLSMFHLLITYTTFSVCGITTFFKGRDYARAEDFGLFVEAR